MDKEKFLSGYFTRIGYAGSTELVESTLRDISYHQSLAIPFENTYVLAKKSVTMAKKDLYEKMIVNKRGGFCFEVNVLLFYVLQDMGFDVALYAGNVFGPDGKRRNLLEHIIVVVNVSGKRVTVDCGFGGRGHYTVMALTPMQEVQVGNGRYRFAEAGEEYILQRNDPPIVNKQTMELVKPSSEKPSWSNLYGFKLISRTTADLKEGLEFHTRDPKSRFVQNLVVTLMKESGKVVIDGNLLRIYEFGPDGRHYSTERILVDDDLKTALNDHFGLDPI